MTGKLSASHYIKNNLNRVGLLSVTFGLFLAMVYSLGILLESSFVIIRNVLLDQNENVQIVCVNESRMQAEYGTAEALEGIRANVSEALDTDAVCCDLMKFYVNTAVGRYPLSYAFLAQKKTEVQYFLDYYQAELMEGAMPENASEILIGEAYAVNMNKKVGDHLSFKNSVRYHIVGIVGNKKQTIGRKTPNYLIVGLKREDVFPGAVILFSGGTTINKAGQKEGLIYYDILKENPKTVQLIKNGLIEHIVDYTSHQKEYEFNRDAISNVVNMIRTVSTIAVFICLLVIFNLYMNDRLSEWCLYHSIGYASKEIYFLIVRELMIVLGIAVFVGLLGILGLYVVLNNLIFAPLGQILILFDSGEAFGCLSILTLFFGILQASVFYAVQRIKTVDAIGDDLL